MDKCISIFLILIGFTTCSVRGADRLSFNRDVRPILADKCFACHGFDEEARQADLRLDVRDRATAVREGVTAISPGQPEASELVRRIEAAADERMPPADSNKTLTTLEKQILRRWVAEGAEYETHWSFLPPRTTALPAIHDTAWPKNEIDYFVLAKLERDGLRPTAEAQRETLLRRVSFDLTGLPPSLDELDEFLADQRPGAYERAVDRLLASPRFGERMAVDWLDLARYADTNGYFGDKTRSLWPWRDWVIAAFNRNMSFNEFTIEQLAGDRLPNPTRDQRVATGFNRNHMANNETGIIDEEFRVEYVSDRLETTAATWLGLTVGCARCHDHKFDPISQKEFYQLFAFFNNLVETGLITKDNPPPILEVPTPEQEARLRDAIEVRQQAEQAFATAKPDLQKQVDAWEQTASQQLIASPADPLELHVDFDGQIDGKAVGTTLQYEPGILGRAVEFDATQHAELQTDWDVDSAWTIGVWLQANSSLSCVLSKIEPNGNRRGLELLWQKGRLQVNLSREWGVRSLEVVTREAIPGKKWQQVVLTYDGSGRASGLHIFVNGQRVDTNAVRDALDGSIRNAEPLRIGRRDSGLGFYGRLDELRILGRAMEPREIEEWFWSERLRGIFATPAARRDSADRELLSDYYIQRHADAHTRELHHQRREAQGLVSTIQDAIPTTLVMQELAQPRPTNRLIRGQYNQPGEVVHADVPGVLPPFPTSLPRDRLGFARWLMSPDNPLTPRVTVNRLWQQCFGEGLVRTVTDFGAQGELPTHAELLDWLAVRLVQDNWDLKAMLRRIVTSATYRQSSIAPESLLARDFENRLLARGPRFRLSAEMVRDQALFAAGLLVERLGGPSVKPIQPPGLWEAVSYNGEESYVADRGEGLWRRTMYSFWKRQAPPPAMITFDGPTREKCTARRARTNTPLQALVLLNDETYLAAAGELASWVLQRPGNDDARLSLAHRRVLSRLPSEEELAILRHLLLAQRRRFTERQDAAQTLVASCRGVAHQVDVAERAAWMVTLHSLFNLDEAITRR